MGSFFKHRSIAKIIRLGVAALSTVMVVACGGGGGSPGITLGTGGGGSSASTGSITLDLVDATTGLSKTTLTTSAPLVARATVKDSAGKPLAGTIVTFALGGSFAVLSPASGTGLTNSSGVATIMIAVKDLATAQEQAGSADTVTATATVGTQALIAKTTFSIGAPSVSLKLVVPSSGTVSLDAYRTTLIQVDVLANGVVYTAQPVTVNFTSSCAISGKASLPATATTSNGRAQVVYTDNGCGATDNVTISTAGAPSVSVSIVVASPVASSIGFVSATPADKAIVIKGSTATGRVDQATLTFIVKDILGNALPNKLVKFSVLSQYPVTLNILSQTSGPDGKVVTTVNSGTQATSFRVVATLANPDGTDAVPKVSATSDTITVTTGQAVQRALSLSVETFNIEGWNYDNQQTKVNVLLADDNGNPVADNTPVVFGTDSGAIGSSAIGGCITVNGACSVVFRSQEPRYGVGNGAIPPKRAGFATVTASSTSAVVTSTGQTLTLTGQTGVFLSGSSAVNVYYNGTRLVPFSTTALATDACGNYSLLLELNDLNFNPLPFNTAIAATNLVKVAVTEIIPKAVPNIGQHDVIGGGIFTDAGPTSREGTVHIIPITPPASCVSGATGFTETGSVDIKITTPLGSPVVYTFTLAYPIAGATTTTTTTTTTTLLTCTPPQVLNPATSACVNGPKITVDLFDSADAVASNTVSATAVPPANQLTVRATVKDGAGTVVPNQTVNFSVTGPTGAATPLAAVTDAVGIARVKLTAAVPTGIGTVTASATVPLAVASPVPAFPVFNNASFTVAP